ncbi:hypothetical protein O5166_25835, partial [Escherichia coli]|nr:hypothetical protein [Escherichia coli]
MEQRSKKEFNQTYWWRARTLLPLLALSSVRSVKRFFAENGKALAVGVILPGGYDNDLRPEAGSYTAN